MDFILHCMWLTVKAGLGTAFIFIGGFLLFIGCYWFFRGLDYMKNDLDPMNKVDFSNKDEQEDICTF